VTFELDGEPQIVTLVKSGPNSIGKMQVRNAGAGSHTVALVSPAGCFDPIVFNCQVDSPPDPEWDAAWAGLDEVLAVTEPNQAPLETRLIGNYPNPFNPTTTIRYTLHEKLLVSIRVYSVIGEEVAVLVDGVEEAGLHEVVFDARNLPSGTYFYRLVAGEVAAVQRLVVVK
jgi:hypothetical protein